MREKYQLLYYGLFSFFSTAILYSVLTKFAEIDLSNQIYNFYFIYRHLLALIVFYFLIKLYMTYYKYKTKNLFLLCLAMIFFAVSYILESTGFLFINSENMLVQDISYPLFIVSQFMINVGPIFFMAFYINYFKRDIQYYSYLPVILYIALELVLYPIGLTIEKDTLSVLSQEVHFWLYTPKYFWIIAVYYISFVWLVGYLLNLVIKSRKRSKDPDIIRIQNTFIIGVVLIFIVAPLLFMVNIFFSSDFFRYVWISTVGRSFVVLGLVIFVNIFLRTSGKTNFVQKQPLKQLIFFNTDTLGFIYQHIFQIADQDSYEHIAQIIDSLNVLLTEVTDTEAIIEGIEFSDEIWFLRKLDKCPIGFVLITDYDTLVIKEQLDYLESQIAIHLDNTSQLTFDIAKYYTSLVFN